MSGFKGTMPPGEADMTKTTAHWPGLDIEISHRQSPDGSAEHISINLKAVPSFEVFARVMEAFNPFAFWADAARLAWFPWIEATRAIMLPPHRSSLPKLAGRNAEDKDPSD